MQTITSRASRIGILAGALFAAQLAFGFPALAADTVIQELSGGSRTANVTNATMSGLTYAHSV